MDYTQISGLKLIKRSMQLVMAHPVLLIYGASAALLSFFLAFRVEAPSISALLETVTATQWITILFVVILDLFLLACVAHHGMHILKNELHGFKNTLIDVFKSLPKLSVWLLVKSSIGALWIVFMKSLISFLVIAIITIIFNYLTSLVLPILAIEEETSVIAAIKRSYRLVLNFFGVFIVPFLIFKLCGLLPLLVINILLQHWEILTYTVFYYEYYARPKPELADIFYPDV